eukprot:1158925-Pelagomonas_calceolata.AAC.1
MGYTKADLELLSKKEVAAETATGSVGGAGQGSWEHGEAGQTCSRGRYDGPHSHSSQPGGSRELAVAAASQEGRGTGACLGRLSELMEVSEYTTDEAMEGGGE